MRAKDIMITDFSIISTKSLVADAVKQLKKNFGDESYMNAAPGLVVLNEQGELAGILSPLTILRAIMDRAAANDQPSGSGDARYLELCQPLRKKLVEEIMDWQAISITEDADLLDVADIFVKHRFQRIPVVRGKSVVGVIYRSRLMFALTTCLDESN